ncbi:MAG: DUF2849 domain-containing protein [Alphaproteobacteria bacterium]|nr:DUF2849 domain-containing protein [Alphaproteobacteria bacterium]
MAKPLSQILTANRLRDGDVVYWHGGRWVEALGEADIFAAEAEAKAALEAAQQAVAANVVVNPYLFEVRPDADGPVPVKEREIVRAAGPTVHADLGKQAGGLTPDSIRRAAAARDVRAPVFPAKERDNDVSI